MLHIKMLISLLKFFFVFFNSSNENDEVLTDSIAVTVSSLSCLVVNQQEVGSGQ